MFWVYVLRNQDSDKIYIGQTKNLERRVTQHNDSKFIKYGKNAYTKINKGKWILAYKEIFNTRKEAIIREKYLKSHIGRNWLKDVIGSTKPNQ